MIQSLAPELLFKQVVTIVLACSVFVLASVIPFKTWLAQANKIYWLNIALLILPFILNQEIRQTARWINIGNWFQLQPSQLAFPLIGLTLVAFLSKNSLSQASTKIKAWGIIILPTIIIAFAPNLSTASFFVLLMAGVLFLAGLPIKNFLMVGVLVTLGLGLGWQTWLKDYQKARLTSFFTQDLSSAGNYNARQALIAVGSGGLLGQGYDNGTQSKLKFLPERHTDFIFASYSEQFGLIGSLSLVTAYVLIISFILHHSIKTDDPGARLYLALIGLMLGMQTFIAIGTNIGLLPITGLTLPFISTGGSSLLSMALALGITQRLVCTIPPDKTTHLV